MRSKTVTVHNNNVLDWFIGVGGAIGGGMTSWLMQIQVAQPFPVKVAEAAVIAIVSGLCGLLVKELFYAAKNKWFKNEAAKK